MADKPDPLINSVVAGRYEIFAKLGEGGMGTVYAAKQKPLGRTIALKVLLKSLSDDEIAVQRFEKEALAISRLAHPNTVTIFDYGKTEQGLMYIAMEFMEGRTLSDLIKQEGPLRPRRVVRIVAQMIRALSEAHLRGVIHRDLKPDNIMLVPTAGEPDFVKVLDFGVAKLRSQGGVDVKTLTKGDVIFGTPSYMSPQQVHGIMDDPRSDLYAVGVIAYEMLSGAALFTGDSAISILMAQVQKIPQAFASLPKPVEVPAELEALVMKLLAKESDDRFADCEAVLHGLDKLPGLGGGLRPPSGDTMGMQRSALASAGQAKRSTQMMGSDFANVKDSSAKDSEEKDLPEKNLPEKNLPKKNLKAPAQDKSSAAKAAQDSREMPTEAMALPDATLVDDDKGRLASSGAASDPGAKDSGISGSDADLDIVPKKKFGLLLLMLAALVVVALLFAKFSGFFGSETGSSETGGSKTGGAALQQVQLEVSSNPAAAQIFLDDKAVGLSPLSLSVQPGATYSLRAELANYKTSTQEVKVTTHTSMQFNLVPLAPAPATDNLPAHTNQPAVKADADKKDVAQAGAHKKPKTADQAPSRKPKQQQPKPLKADKDSAPQADDDKTAASKVPLHADSDKTKTKTQAIPNEGTAADFEKFDDFKAVE